MKQILTLFVLFAVVLSFDLSAEDISQKGMTQTALEIENIVVTGKISPVKITPRGMTHTTLPKVSYVEQNQISPYIAAPKKSTNKILGDAVMADYSDWTLCDSIFVHSLVPAGKNVGVKIYTHDKNLSLVSPHAVLSYNAREAINKAPVWIRPELESTLSQVVANKREELADIINRADHHLIDEIAYSIAYSSHKFLSSSLCFPQLYLENAQLIYANDKDLPYVEIVEYGNYEDGDYYTTVKYWKNDSTRGKLQIEVPKDIYYMYIVHPKITDEMATYIIPGKKETDAQNRHINSIAAPPAGVFWRNYLYNHTEEVPDDFQDTSYDLPVFPILKDSVRLCDVIWDDKNETSQAVRVITQWVKEVMFFNHDPNERPHQPVRIYDQHLGRCGEHEDLTVAASRACLIPCRGVDGHSFDHVWNEFWDEQWWQWEPVNTSHKRPLAYITWGVIGTVSARHSSGSHENVTDVYNDENNSEVTINTLDASGRPMDGATIRIYKYSAKYDAILFDTYAVSDNEGKCKFVLGQDNKYYLQLHSDLGNVPASSNQVTQFLDNSPVGQTLEFEVKAPNSRAPFKYFSLAPSEDPTEDYMLRVNFTVEKAVTNWRILFNDYGNCDTYLKSDGVAKLNFFITDEANYNKCLNGDEFDTPVHMWSVESGEFTFDIPIEDSKTWFAFLNNSVMMKNYQLVNASFALYNHPSVGVDEKTASNLNLSARPNPFSSSAQISFNLSEAAEVNLSIYNAAGELVSMPMNAFKSAGEHTAELHAENIPTGTYFCTISHNGRTETVKLVLVK